MRTTLKLTIYSLTLPLSACGDSDTAERNAVGDEKIQPVEMAETRNETSTSGSADAAGGSMSAGPEPMAGAVEESARPDMGDLTAYVGKFPFDEVGGVTWTDHPQVKAGIRKTVTDTSVRNAITTLEGPSAPIATYKGKVGSWSCQAHNCGDHQWAVLVDPRSGATDVCYHDAAKTGQNSRWFLADGREESRPGNCSVV